MSKKSTFGTLVIVPVTIMLHRDKELKWAWAWTAVITDHRTGDDVVVTESADRFATRREALIDAMNALQRKGHR